MEIMTVQEYASLRNCAVQNVYNQIYANRELPGVISYKQHGRSYILHVERNEVAKIKKKKVSK